MSNKYSHALVLSHHEQQGLTEFLDARRTKPLVQTLPEARKAYHLVDPPLQLPRAAFAKARVQLPSSQDLLRPHSARSRHEEGTDSRERSLTEATLPQARSESNRQTICDDDYTIFDRPIPSPPWLSNEEDSTNMCSSSTNDEHERIPAGARDRPLWEEAVSSLDLNSSGPYNSTKRRQRRGTNDTNDTAIWDPPTHHGTSTPQHASIPKIDSATQHPLTPPLTPRMRKSWETFSIDLNASEPLPSPKVSRQLKESTPPSTAWNSSSGSSSALESSLASHPRPTSSAHHKIPQRSSSIKTPSSIRSPLPLDLFDPTNANPLHQLGMPTSPSFSLSSRNSLDSLDLDADLEPLPPDLSTDPDFFASLPWADNNAAMSEIPAVSRILRLENDDEVGTIRSSFDSAAPPPISLGANEGIRRPIGLPEEKLGGRPESGAGRGKLQKLRSPSPSLIGGRESDKKENKLPLRSLMRAGYLKPASNTTSPPGEERGRITVNKTSVPSLPSLFTGAFPKRNTTRERGGSRPGLARMRSQGGYGQSNVVKIAGREYKPEEFKAREETSWFAKQGV